MGRPRQPIPHGTDRGYRLHKDRGTEPCDKCRDAWAAAQRRRRGGQEHPMDTITITPTVARVPVGEQPADPWTWWDGDGEVFPPHQVRTTWRPSWMLGDHGLMLTGRVRWWQRGRTRGELQQDADLAARLWADDPGRAGELVEGLPQAWRRRALARVGYSSREIPGGVPIGRRTTHEPDQWRTEPGPDDGRWGRTWEEVHERVAADAVQADDGRWYRPGDIAGLVLHDGRWWRPTARIARAPEGTRLPDGWEPVAQPGQGEATLGETLAHAAPPHLTATAAQRVWDQVQATEMTIIVVAPTPDGHGRHEAWRGVGGHAVSAGRHPSIDAAVTSARAEIDRIRDGQSWIAPVLGGWPEVEVVEARSPGWDAVAAAR